MDFGFTEEQKMLRDSVRKLMDKHASPEYIRRLERERHVSGEYRSCSVLSPPST